VYAAREKKGWLNKLRLFIGKPADFEAKYRLQAEERFLVTKNDVPVDQPLNRYVIWQIAGSIILLFVFILFEKNIPTCQQVLIAIALLLTLINCGAIMEQKKWIVYLEFLRLLTVTIGLMILYSNWWSSILLLPAVIILYTYYFENIRNWYLRLVYNDY
jgi:alkylglycerol monooxygenase